MRSDRLRSGVAKIVEFSAVPGSAVGKHNESKAAVNGGVLVHHEDRTTGRLLLSAPQHTRSCSGISILRAVHSPGHASEPIRATSDHRLPPHLAWDKRLDLADEPQKLTRWQTHDQAGS